LKLGFSNDILSRMQKYELTLVLDGKASAAKKKAVTESIEKIVALGKGKMDKVNEWGVRDLAYKMGKSTSGVYLHFPLELETEVAQNLLGKIRANEDIIRYLLVREGR